MGGVVDGGHLPQQQPTALSMGPLGTTAQGGIPI